MTHQGLGEFEQMVLLAIAHLRGEAYGIPIVEEIERRTGRSVARAAVYITLRRLEEKGFVSSWMSAPTPERGGKGRRYVKLEAEGARALREARRAAERMWQGLDPPALGGAVRPAPTPPRFPRALLRLAVPDESRDAVDGDLHEIYLARRASSGATA